jgi:hypothetical protein
MRLTGKAVRSESRRRGLALLCTCSALFGVQSSLTIAAPREQAGDAAGKSAPNASPAIDGVLDLFKKKSVVALGDAHGLAQEEAFYSAVILDPRFAEQVGNVVVEFGGAIAQGTVDRYVAGEEVTFAELRRVWTDTAGAFSPGEPVPVGLINFFANVRAANLKLTPDRRIKVWLGDPSIDWSQIRSFQDLQPFLRKRDENMFGILDAQILGKQKKALLIVGLGHLFGPGGGGPLSERIARAYPGALAIVSPFIGYLEPECNAKFLARAKGWPTPAIVDPVQGTSLEASLQLPNCNFIPPSRIEKMKSMAAHMPKVNSGGAPPGAQILGAGPGGGGPPSPTDMIAAEIDIMSGRHADAILYLGPPDTLTQAPIEDSLYLDSDYFKEAERRAKCCVPFGPPPNWVEILRRNSVTPQKFDRFAQ